MVAEKVYNEDKKSDSNGVDYPSDTESQVYDAKAPGQLQRKLKNRHIAMIRYARPARTARKESSLFLSIGGVIGTGLFLGTAGSLQNAGPVGLLLGYAIVGTVAYAVMVSVGEMVSYLPVPGGHIALAARFVNPAFSFTMVSPLHLFPVLNTDHPRVRDGIIGTTGQSSCLRS